jgi:predicted DNA-binding transcriptional regulator AlpA
MSAPLSQPIAFQRKLVAREVEEAVGLKRERIRQLEAAGTFPKRFKIAGGKNYWSADAVAQWVDDQVNKPRERAVLRLRKKGSASRKAVA